MTRTERARTGAVSEECPAVAKEDGVPLADLHTMRGTVYLKLGDAGSADLSYSPADRTHFSERGARIMADLVTAGLKEKAPGLGVYVVEK